MTREEEIKQAIDNMFPFYEDMSDIEVLQTASRRIGAEKAFEYADQTIIDKACEWLEPVFKNYAGYYCGTDLVEDFRKYMKGE